MSRFSFLRRATLLAATLRLSSAIAMPATAQESMTIAGVPANARVTIQRVDSNHGNVLPRYAAMGKPLDPMPEQVEQLNLETALPASEKTALKDGALALTLTPNALVLVKVAP